MTISSEKVEIKKPYIILEGDLNHPPVIEFGDAGSVVDSPTFKLNADNFVARNIVFKVKHQINFSFYSFLAYK